MVQSAPQHPTLAFRDLDFEAAYMDAFGREVRGFYRAAIISVLVMWTASVGLDLAAAPAARGPFLAIRFGMVMPVMVLALALNLGNEARYLRWWHLVGAIVYATTLLGVVGLAVFATERSVVAYVFSGFVMVTLIGGGLGLIRAAHVCTIAVGTSVAMVIALATSPHVSRADLAVDALWLFVSVFAAAVTSVLAEQGRRRQFTLLTNLLPTPIAARLQGGGKVIADALGDVTVLFADLKGFSELTTTIPPAELVGRLDRVFTAFDALARTHGLEKIKTIGDAYMAVSGAPFARPDHAADAARMAQAMIAELATLEPTLALRVGLATGPVVAGVIGRSKLVYDVWGETVNLASRMESHGLPGRIQISARTQAALGDAFAVEDRGEIELKGLGMTAAFLLSQERAPRS